MKRNVYRGVFRGPREINNEKSLRCILESLDVCIFKNEKDIGEIENNEGSFLFREKKRFGEFLKCLRDFLEETYNGENFLKSYCREALGIGLSLRGFEDYEEVLRYLKLLKEICKENLIYIKDMLKPVEENNLFVSFL